MVNGDPRFPSILTELLDLLQHQDEELSEEAGLALKFFFERECLCGNGSWRSEVEQHLDFQDNLVRKTGANSIKELHVSPDERDSFAFEVFRRIRNSVPNAWRHAYVLKQALCVTGLQDDIAAFLRENWRLDEAVSSHLLNILWDSQITSGFERTLADIQEKAKSQELRDRAKQELGAMRELEKCSLKKMDE